MTQRRPPAYPLPRGLIWKEARADEARADDPIAEWAYRTPEHPQGLTSSALRLASHAEQFRLAEYWFRLNFAPVEGDRRSFQPGFTTFNSVPFRPERGPARAFLEEEFAGLTQPVAIHSLANVLQTESEQWSPVPPDPTSIPFGDASAAAQSALDLVQADLTRVGLGHNQGPPLDPAIVAEIRNAVRMGFQAVSAGGAGKDAAGSAATGLITLAGTIGSAFAQGVAKKAGEDAEPFIKHGLAVLLDHMLQAASALLHWIASIPSGPLL